MVSIDWVKPNISSNLIHFVQGNTYFVYIFFSLSQRQKKNNKYNDDSIMVNNFLSSFFSVFFHIFFSFVIQRYCYFFSYINCQSIGVQSRVGIQFMHHF